MRDAPNTSEASAHAEPGAYSTAATLAGAGGAALLGAGDLLSPRVSPKLRSPRPAARSASASAAAARPTTSTPRSSTAPRRRRAGRSSTRRSYGSTARSSCTTGSATSACQTRPANVWTVRLKQGLEFHNGKTVTADDVLFSIAPLLDPEDRAPPRPRSSARVDMKRSKKLDDRTVEFVLKRPTSFFDEILSDIVYIIPVGYNPKKPVSTGPVEAHQLQAGPADRARAVRELLGPQADASTSSSSSSCPTTRRASTRCSPGRSTRSTRCRSRRSPCCKANGNLQTVVSPTAAWNPITMRVDTAPFNDVRVRQAIRLVMDRKQAVQTALFGQGVPASDYYGRFDPVCRHEPPARRPTSSRRSRC